MTRLSENSRPLIQPSQGQVDLWWKSFAELAPSSQEYSELLSDQEIERRDAYVIKDDGQKFSLSRGFLRVLLGAYLEVPPDEICFSIKPDGKPCLEKPASEFDLKFNLSRTKNDLAIAVSASADVGVDIEQPDPTRDVLAIAQRFFSLSEYEALAALDEDQRHPAFLRCWTRKEALMKADGGGMKLVADIEPGFNTLANSCATHLVSGKEYAYTDLVLENGVQATIALKGPSITINLKK